MEFQLDNGKYQIVFSTSNLNIAIEESAPLNVIIGDTTEIDVGQVITYIKSGEKEINEAVQQGIAFFDSNAQEKTDVFNVNATEVQAKINAIVPDIKEDINNLYKNKQDNLSSINAGTGISIVGSGANVLISNTQTSAEWGNITGDITNQEDLQRVLNEKQTILTFDNTPMSNSSNPVTSNGIYEAIDNIMQNISSSLEIGDIGFASLGIDETQNKRRYLNGQVISQTQFETFTNKVKERAKLYPNIITTEENWQAEVTNSKLSQCGKFVIDDTLGTIRLPKVVNINGLQDLALMGSIKAESLPNITGSWGSTDSRGGNVIFDVKTGAFSTEERTTTRYTNSTTGTTTADDGMLFTFDASRVSSTYQDNAPVQQEAVQYPYFIQVATGVEESVDITREIELNNPFSLLDYKWSEYELNNASWLISNGTFHSGTTYLAVYKLLLKIYNGIETKNGVSVKLSTEEYTDTDFVINTTDTTFRLPIRTANDYVVENYNDGTSWYRVYKSGWVEQGGVSSGAASGKFETVVFLKPFKDTNYTIVGQAVESGTTLRNGATTDMLTKTPTSIQIGIYGGTSNNNWVACGYGVEAHTNKTYFYVGETIQDANVINASGVLTRVSNSIDRTIQADRETVVGWGLPDYSAGIAITNQSFTAPADGFMTVHPKGGISGKIYVNGEYVGIGSNKSADASVSFCVSKNDIVTLISGYTFGTQSMFYPLKGVN